MKEIVQHEIDEMAKYMCSSYESEKGCKTCPTNWCYAQECATMAYCNGCRDVKDKVVLTREEYQKDFSSQFNKGYKHGSEETAEKYFNAVIEMLKEVKAFETIDVKDLVFLHEKNKEIAKQFSVEIKE